MLLITIRDFSLSYKLKSETQTHRYIFVFTQIQLCINCCICQVWKTAEEFWNELCSQALFLWASFHTIENNLVGIFVLKRNKTYMYLRYRTNILVSTIMQWIELPLSQHQGSQFNSELWLLSVWSFGACSPLPVGFT